MSLKRHEEALAAFRQAVAGNAQHAFGWGNMGDALNCLKRPQEALACFDKALAIKKYAAAWCGKGDSYGLLEQYQEAILHFQKALEKYDKYPEAWYGKALAEDKMFMTAEAAESYRKFLALNPVKMAAEVELAKKRLEDLA